MQGMKRRSLAVICIAAALVVGPVQSALAAGPDNKAVTETDTDSGLKDDTLYAQAAAISYDTSRNGSGSSAGPLTVSDNTWTPPACWFAPKWTAKQFAKNTEEGYKEISADPNQTSPTRQAAYQDMQNYKDGEYKNYNIDKQDDGMWWGAVENPNAPILDRLACNTRRPFWVENGETPDIPNAISPEILAGLAYQQIKVPGTKVTLAPAAVTKVNLATWAWLDKGDFKPVSVTASLTSPGLNIRATTTATPVSLTLQPGTTDAETYPASGSCAINADGSIGEPWAKGKSGEDPPCGIKYLRASGSSTYPLKATLTWEITWKGSTGDGTFPDGTFGATQDITVQEIQSVN
ncbi:hypothetical protein OK074_8461 [Actinobacteria bacterium OK074]|nr:hypothetical protein OK074_8461 [Actinobacteria bacterium OK074]